jgi:osmotically-inducible protein OsmY
MARAFQARGISAAVRSYYGSDYGRGDFQRGREDDRGFIERATDAVSSWFGGGEGPRHHRGRGPKGYARSDDRIREDVSDRLGDDWLVDATEIEVSVVSGEVTLSGTVNSRDQRRRAEDIAESVSGASTSRTTSG